MAHETESAVEEGGLRGGGGHDGDGDGVLALLQVVHGRIRALGERLDGQRDDVIGHRVVDVLGGGGGAQIAHHAVAEHLVVVQVHDAAELVAERQDNAGEALHTGHVEVLLVELDGVGRFGIGAEGPLRPAGEVRAEPVLRHVVHVVVPLGLEADGIDGGEVTRLEAQEAVVTHTRQGLELVFVCHHRHIQEGSFLPVLLQSSQKNGVVIRRQAQKRLDLFVILLCAEGRYAVHHFISSVLDGEIVAARI